MKTINKWMFHPFDYIAGLPALLIGLGVMAILAGASYLTGVHFDGLIDTHAGHNPSLIYCLIEQPIPWLIFFILLYISGRILSKSGSIRLIDVAGTTAFARIPAILQLGTTLLTIKFLSYSKGFLDKLDRHQIPDLSSLNFVSLIGLMVVGTFALAVLAWEVYLFYKAYSISCNIKGTKAIVSFIVVILLAEGLSKVLLNMAYDQFK